MKDKWNPNTAFISPMGDNKEDISMIFNRFLDLILDYYLSANQRRIKIEFKRMNPDIFRIPKEGQDLNYIINDLKEVFNNSQNMISPRYLGQMDSMPTLMSILGELLKAAINNNMLSEEMSPAFTEMENELMKQFAHFFGYGDDGGGIMASGGSLTNLQAMTIARNKKLNIQDENIRNIKGRPIIFASELAHASIEKNAMILGLGTSGLKKIHFDRRGKMSIPHLKKEIEFHIENGDLPFCVIATIGTTSVGSIDPIVEIARLCRRYDLWLHADAVYGGALIFSGKHNYLLNGINEADSISFNPQKWLSIAKTCSIIIFKRFSEAIDAFRINMSYFNPASSGISNIGEISIQGSRSAEVLKLWLSLRHLGVRFYETFIDKTIQLTIEFEKLIDERSYIEKFAIPETNTILFRLKEIPLSNDKVNAELRNYLIDQSNIYFGLRTIENQSWIKIIILNPYTDSEILQDAVRSIDRFYHKTIKC